MQIRKIMLSVSFSANNQKDRFTEKRKFRIEDCTVEAFFARKPLSLMHSNKPSGIL